MNREKVVCPCYRVTVGEIEDAIREGAASYKDVKKMTKAGKSCGKCKKKVKKIVEELLEAEGKQEKTPEGEQERKQPMKYDFTTIMDRRGMDAIAVDVIPFEDVKVKDGFDRIPMWVI